MNYCFGDYSYSICLWGLKAGQDLRFFPCIVCIIIFYWMSILVNLWRHFLYWSNWLNGHIQMLLDGSCSESGKTNFLAWCCLLVLVLLLLVLCMPVQYRVFLPPAAIIAARRSGMLCYTALQAHFSDFCPFIQQGLAEIAKILWRVVHTLHSTIHPKYILWGCSLAILQSAPFGWRFPAEANQGRSEHGEVWHYRLGRGSYHRNAVWQMALRCFAKCSCRAHWWGICRGAKEAISHHHFGKLPIRVPNHHQLGPYKRGTFAGAL